LIKRNWTYILIAVIFSVAVVRIPVGHQMRELFWLSYKAGVIFILSLYIYAEIDKWAGAFLFLALISHSVPWFVFSGYRIIITKESYIAFNCVLYSIIFYALLIKTDINDTPILNMMCVIALVNSIALIAQSIGFDPFKIFFVKGNLSPTGLMANRNEAGALLGICSAAFFRRRWAFLLPVISIGIFLSDSLNGVLSFIVAGFVYICVFNPKLFVAGAVIAYTAFFIDSINGNESISARLYIWKRSIGPTLSNQPFLGFGLGNWKSINLMVTEAGGYTIPGWTRVHNSFIQGYVEMGSFFVLMAIAYSAWLLRLVVKNIALYRVHISALSAIFICMNTNSLFRMNIINGMLVILWVFMVNKKRDKSAGISD
jgi:hypothetical protein